MLLTIGSESRHLITCRPRFVFFVARGTSRLDIDGIFVFCLIQIAASYSYTDHYLTIQNTPDQYVLIMGSWISKAHFIPFFLFAVIVFTLTYIMHRSKFVSGQNSSLHPDRCCVNFCKTRGYSSDTRPHAGPHST